MDKKGLLVVVSSPSGGGKTTIIRKVLASGNGDFRYSVSATTRKRRVNEVDGKDYHFMDLNQFLEERRKGAFIEWAEVHGSYYATPKRQLDEWLRDGYVIFLDVDVQGGIEIKGKYGDLALLIFIKPPSLQSLRDRLLARKTENETQINKRLERYPLEMEKAKFYDIAIVNEDLDSTVRSILLVINDFRKQN